MKKYISVAALLAAGTMFAGAAVTATQNEDKGWTLTGSGEEINAGFLSILEGSNYTVGDAFEISFTVTGNTFNAYITDSVAQLGTNYYLVSQAGNYLGLSYNADSLSNGTSDPGPNKTGTVNETKKVHEISGAGPVYGWVSLNANQASATYGVSNLQVTLGTDGTNSYVNLNFDGEDEYDTNVTLNGFVLDAGKFALGSNITGASLTTSIPEPSAFGMLAGMGALALVVARRRRR
ncbi:MAG: PEP-CTERM sorting domain-containing protein [Opitutales bacterium]|nr:PEP-CTERM sorting domain-containing protein [Opitutales bacterium]